MREMRPKMCLHIFVGISEALQSYLEEMRLER